MTTFNKALRIDMIATLVFMSPLSNASGQNNGTGPGAFGSELKRLMSAYPA